MMSNPLPGYDLWKTTPPEPTREDAEMELRDQYNKAYRALEAEYDRRLAELDAWFASAEQDLSAEYQTELDKISC